MTAAIAQSAAMPDSAIRHAEVSESARKAGSDPRSYPDATCCATAVSSISALRIAVVAAPNSAKEALFTETLSDSAAEVAAAQLAIVHKHLDEVTDLEAALVALGYEWVTRPVREQFADHFAMVRHINSEAAHFPVAALRAWRELGPRRVHRELAEIFARLQDEGSLRPARPERAVRHFLVLISAEAQERTFGDAAPLDDAALRDAVVDAVATFLTGHLPRE